MMSFLWCALIIASGISSMHNPALAPNIKKYACCPNDFGYRPLGMNGDRLIVYPCDLEETRSLDDEVCHMEIRNCLFKCLLVELSFQKNPEAQQSFESLIQRLRNGRIKMSSEEADGGYTHLTRKDFFHRILAHLPGYLEIDPYVFVRQWCVGLVFVPCIHRVESFGYKFAREHEQYIFSDEIQQQFKSIKPFPSLMALAVRAIPKADRNKAIQFVPDELKPLFY